MRAALLALVLVLTGCGGFQVNLSRAHEAVKAMSEEVQPPLAALCLSKARACHAAGDKACKPLHDCRKLKVSYVVAVKALHTALAEASNVHRQLQREGVVE